MMLGNFKALVFDCDGVVLNSNKVKTTAFYQTALSYGEAAAQAMVEYHIANGGVSRYKKFSHFIEKIVPVEAPNTSGPNLETLLDHYANQVRQGLLNCEVAKGLEKLREETSGARWLIVSGGAQTELLDVFTECGIAEWFDGGIFGSPDTKDEVLKRELSLGNIQLPALFFGDSKYDYQAATGAGLDFVFLSEWSEVEDWRTWAKYHDILTYKSIQDLLAFSIV